MLEKEIIEILELEQRLEDKYTKAKKRAETIHINTMKEAQKKAESIKLAAEENFLLMQDRFNHKTKIASKQMQDKTSQTIKTITGCHQDLSSLAKKTCQELLGELKTK